MASCSECTSRKFFAREVAAYSDAELDQYLEENRLDGGAMAVDVEDPENLPESFIQRLRDRAQLTSDTNQSRPVDAGLLTSRLLELSSGRNTLPRPSTPPFDCESPAETLPPSPANESEKSLYTNLVEEGGRPLYSIDLVDKVAEDPLSHWDMLRPWLCCAPDFVPDPDPDSFIDWTIFQRQLNSWRRFRCWQNYNRNDDTGSGPYWQVYWEDMRSAYDRFVRVFRRHSATYTDAVKKLLAEYGFNRPFQFHEDPTQQDKLTTWIEYLGYECWVHYRYDRYAKRLRPTYDTAWKTLVDSNVLRPFETEKIICDNRSAIQRQSEREQATRAVTSARLAAKAVLRLVYNDINNPRGSRHTPAARVQMMEAAKSRCEEAEKALASIARRNDLVTEFKVAARDYLIEKKNAERHRIRARWILEQVPLIEAELNASSVGETGSDAIRGIKRRFGRDDDGEAMHNRMVKKRRWDACAPGPAPGRQDGPGPQGAKAKRSRDDTADDDRPPSKRFKRGGDGDDVGSQGEISDDADIGLARGSQEPGIIESGRPDGNERAMRAIERPNSKKSKPSSDRLQRRKSTRNAPQPSTTTQPPRRSARIAARREALQTVATRSGAVKSLPRSSGRNMAQSPAPPSSTGSQSRYPRLLATMKTRKQGARGGGRRDMSRVK